MAIQIAPAPTAKLITGEELATMGEIGPSELVEGRIVMRSPTSRRHGRTEGRFYRALDDFVTPRQLGEVDVGEVGIYIRRNPDTIRAADVLFLSKERASRLTSDVYLDVAPDLVVEVLSPDDRWSEVMQKLREYFEIGVRLIWVADPATRTVYAYHSLNDVRVFAESDALPGDDVLPGFSVPVGKSFE